MSEPWPGHIRLPDKAEEDVLINYSNPKTNLGGEISFFWIDLFNFRARDKTKTKTRQKKHEYKWKTEYKKRIKMR